MHSPNVASPSMRVNGSSTSSVESERVGILDVLTFAGLETLGSLAILGNISLIVVLLRNKYLNRASFTLMLSLAIADVLHGVVTTSFFFPPIILKYTHVGTMAIRLFNIVDWTAWAVTLTHISAICLDRLVAIMLYGKYNQLVTITRVSRYCVFCWTFFFSLNSFFFCFNLCCLTQPLADHNYYTFGYAHQLAPRVNAYTLSYTPLEVLTICILSISNPITLVQLYRRHKRKVALRMQGSARMDGSLLGVQRSQWQRASKMLLEMSMKMGSRHAGHEVRDVATRRANRQQQRILVQISVVALIFYAYMTAYYISYYVSFLQSTATMIFNSFFYSTTHMINPVIYFSLNKEMRDQLGDALKAYCRMWTCQPSPIVAPSRSNTHREHTVDRTLASCATYSETVPFLSSSTNYKVTGSTPSPLVKNERGATAQLDVGETLAEDVDGEEAEDSDGPFGDSRIMVSDSRQSQNEENWNIEGLEDKMRISERPKYLSGLLDSLDHPLSDVSSVSLPSCDNLKKLSGINGTVKAIRKNNIKAPRLQTSSSLDVPSNRRNGSFIRLSNTLQVISRQPCHVSEMAFRQSSSLFDASSLMSTDGHDSTAGEVEDDANFVQGRGSSLRAKLIGDTFSSDRLSGASSSSTSSMTATSWKNIGPLSDSVCLRSSTFIDSSDDDDDGDHPIAFL